MSPSRPKLSLKNRALGYLSMREHSRLELSRKLQRYAEEGDDVEAVLDFMEQHRFLSEERFTEALIRRRLDSYGNQRIMAELQTHGLDAELLQQSRQELAGSEVARARAVWQKKFGPDSRAGLLAQQADDLVAPDWQSTREQRMKQVRYLAQRGFSNSAIRAAMQQDSDDGS